MRNFRHISNLSRSVLSKRLSLRNSLTVSTFSTIADPFRAVTNLKTSYTSSVSDLPLVSKTIPDLIKQFASYDHTAYTFPHQGIQHERINKNFVYIYFLMNKAWH